MTFREALEARIGERAETARPIAKGMIAGLLGANLPSKVHATQVTTKRVGLRVELRLWARTARLPLWFSAGVYTLPAHRYAWCWLLARVQRRPDRIPRARVV